MASITAYLVAAFAEISGCFAFWAWLRLDGGDPVRPARRGLIRIPPDRLASASARAPPKYENTRCAPARILTAK